MPAGPADPRPDDADGVVLTGVQIEGATIYPEAEFVAVYEPYLDRLLRTEDAEKIVAAITDIYRQDGYILSRAVAQPQDLDFGLLRIDVTEGYIEKVTFEGPVEARRDLLVQFAHKLRAVRPLTQQALERYVMLMGDLPGLKARPALRALDDNSGAHELVISLTQDSFDGYASIDNRSTRTVGRHVAQLSGNFNSLFGQFGRTAVNVYTVPDNIRELMFVEGQQEFTLNAEGSLLGVSAWHSVVESGARDKQFNLDSYDTRAAVYLVQPIIRSSKKSLFLTGTFEYHDTTETIANAISFEDRIRSARLTARGFAADPLNGENVLIVTASQGLDFLDASSNASSILSRTGGKINYAKIEGFYTRYQKLPGAWTAQFGLKGQLTSDGALSGEEFRAGGGNFGRAYDPSEISGEHGAAGYLELQRSLASRNEFFRGTQIFAFYDLAAAWDDDPSLGTTKTSIASGGIGARTLLPKDIRLTIEVAKPLTEPVFNEGVQGEYLRFFFGLSMGF
ncbi:MAG: POTRA domain-containing protein [Alphaproteobacteria bacterium]|nr:POTRA domain-containing protein [Alphaproteobacteria bacterium]